MNTFTKATPGVRLVVLEVSVTQISTPRTKNAPCVAVNVMALSASSYWPSVAVPDNVNVFVASSHVPVTGLSTGWV